MLRSTSIEKKVMECRALIENINADPQLKLKLLEYAYDDTKLAAGVTMLQDAVGLISLQKAYRKRMFALGFGLSVMPKSYFP